MSRPAARLFLLGLAVLTGLLPASAFADAWKAAPMDWPHWRGPEMNGVSREKGIVEKWNPKGENLLWKNEELAGRSTPIIMNGLLYTMVRDQPGTQMEAEKVVCVDAATGEKVWENRWNAFLTDVPDTRIGWSNVVGDPETGNVVALGVCGYFQCMDGKTGKALWAHSMTEEYGMLTTYGGRTNMPIICGDLAIISGVLIGWGEFARPQHRWVAFDKRNGQAVWFSGTRPLPDDTTFSAPIITVANGQELMIVGSGDGTVTAFQPQTGRQVWSYDASLRGVNTTPLVIGDRVICAHAEENLDDTTMGALFALDPSKTGDITKNGVVWRHKEWGISKSTPVAYDGRIYACDDTGAFMVINAENGELISEEKLGGPSRPSPLFVDGKIYVASENGRFTIFKPSEKGVDTVFRLRLSGEECQGSIVVSHGRLYLPTTGALYCIGESGKDPSADPRPEWPQAAPASEDPEPAQLQIVPVESMMSPDFKQRFTARLYNSRGQYLKKADSVEYNVAGPGEIDSSGTFVAPKELPAPAAVIVAAKSGELTTKARIRINPDLPWTFDFSNAEVPANWVGMRYRHIVIDFDLYQKIKAADPLAAELYVFIMSGFINTDRPALAYDNSTPAQAWTELLRFLRLQDDSQVLRSIEGAKAKINPSLEVLKSEGVIAGAEWSEVPSGVKLAVQRGSRKVEGNGVMCKITTVPKGTRSQGWMGPIDLHDYTIQADVYGVEKNGTTPDIGLIAQRYAIDLQGISQQLQIRTWHSTLRMAQTKPFQWKGNVWYTMKLRASNEDGKAVLRGKVWPRDEAEPQEWTLEATDDSPNSVGSPGFFGNAKDAEIFYDNISVTKNAS